MPDYRVISIGTLSHHPLWANDPGGRTPHATTTLVRTDQKTILVDPALPGEALEARLNERSGLSLSDVTDVFLTNFRPAHRGGLPSLQHAHWYIHEPERETIGVELLRRFEDIDDEEARDTLRQEIAMMKATRPAPDKLAEGVDLFPMAGFTPGTCGLLLPLANITLLIAGDAAPTVEHIKQGQVLKSGYDATQATESLKEAIEIADWFIPGHDNLTPNPVKKLF